MLSRWLLSVLYILVGGANLIRGVTGWAVSSSVVTQPLSLPVVSTLYVVFGFVFLVVSVFAYRKSRLQRCRVAVGLALLYQLAIWTIRGVGIRSSYVHSLWLRDLLLSVLFLLIVTVLSCGNVRWMRRGRHGGYTVPDRRDVDEQ